MITKQDAHNLLVLLNIGVEGGVYNLEQTPVLAVLARKLKAIKDEQDSDPSGQPDRGEPAA